MRPDVFPQMSDDVIGRYRDRVFAPRSAVLFPAAKCQMGGFIGQRYDFLIFKSRPLVQGMDFFIIDVRLDDYPLRRRIAEYKVHNDGKNRAGDNPAVPCGDSFPIAREERPYQVNAEIEEQHDQAQFINLAPG